MNYGFLVLIGLAVISCNIRKTTFTDSPKIINVVGEIFHDSLVDDSNFKICGAQNRIVQYYAFPEKTYEGEKSALIEHFNIGYQPLQTINESGLIRIRFVVNCAGQTGRFRLLAMDSEYQKKEFSSNITKRLLALTKSFNGWKAMQANGNYRDYYQYLIFKIEKGRLIELMP